MALKKVGNLTPQEFKAAINRIIDLIEDNQLDQVKFDVTTAAPTNGQQLTFNSTSGKFEPDTA